MTDILSLTVAALALWRVSAWLFSEHGAQGLRGWLCRSPFWAQQVSCFFCITAWMALPITLIWWAWWYALIPLALSGAALLLSGGGRIIWREMVDNG